MGVLRFVVSIPIALLRIFFVVINKVYCIPTYLIWIVLLTPLRFLNPRLFRKIEGLLFHWLLAMVSMWSWSAGYDIMEMGDDIRKCIDDRTLLLVNHQSTADVPMLMHCFNARPKILPNIMWIMDKVFMYTTFGLVSVAHNDFFILAGKKHRENSLLQLKEHLCDKYIPLERKWIVLFPEGGFLRKRRATSQRYAVANNLPVLNHVTLPRAGAISAIMNELYPKRVDQTIIRNNNSISTEDLRIITGDHLSWVIDLTIAYPEVNNPLTFGTIATAWRRPCKIVFFYRVFPIAEVPESEPELLNWLVNLYQDKERMLDIYYKTGSFPFHMYSKEPTHPYRVQQDWLRYLMLHLFFILSSFFHYKMFYTIYNYYLN